MTARQQRFAIFAAVNVALIALGWFMLISPQRSKAASASAQEQQVQQQLADLTNKPAPGPAKQPAIHTADLYRLGTALPSQLDTPDLLLELDRLAAGSHVRILNLTPQQPVGATNYTVQPINLTLSGSYYNITAFLRSLRVLVSEQHGRLIANGPLFAVTSVSLAPGNTSDGTAHGESATVAMAAYYYGIVGGASAPAPPADTTTTSTTGG